MTPLSPSRSEPLAASAGAPGRSKPHAASTGPSRHGRTGYCNGCRCSACRSAASAAQRSWTKRRYLAGGPLSVPVVGSVRRIRALQTIGWSQAELGRRVGRDQRWIAQLCSSRKYVHLHTALLIRELYDRLVTRSGPSAHARKIAATFGYESPEAWTGTTIDDPAAVPWQHVTLDSADDVDHVAVVRAASGDLSIPLNRAEMAEAWRRLEGWQLSAEQISELLGPTSRTVTRWRTGKAHPTGRAGDCSPSARRAARNLRVVGA